MPRGGIRILFAGGGTGGHVFPGIALARHAVNAEIFRRCTSLAFDAARLSWGDPRLEPIGPIVRVLSEVDPK